MPKTQAPITKQTPSSKAPNPKHSGPHVFGALGIVLWGLFGYWDLGIGYSARAHLNALVHLRIWR